MKSNALLPFLASLLVWLSGPVLAAETNSPFARWEKDIAAFERADATNPPPRGGIEFIGSSTIRGWRTLAQDFPGQPVFNRGFGGSQIVDSTHFAARVIMPYAPRRIVLRAGGNDLWAGKTPEQVFADFKQFTAVVHAQLPQTEIVFLSLSPSPARWKQHEQEKELNRRVQEFVRESPHLKYLEAYDLPLDVQGLPRPELFVSDQLHFNAQGYQLLADRVRPLFAEDHLK